MKIKILIGNIFESEAQTLVNAVNCVGVMGKGIALEFKKQFPYMFEDYASVAGVMRSSPEFHISIRISFLRRL